MRLQTVVFMMTLLISQPALANWLGNYLNVNQAGMGVELSANNEYVLYIVQDNQATPIDIGIFQVSGNQIQFTSAQDYSNTYATINQESCSFVWGEAGEFSSDQTACTDTGNSTGYENLISAFSTTSFNMIIPQLGLSDGLGGMTVLQVALQLTSMEPLQLTVTYFDTVENPVDMLSAIYLDDTAILYIPYLYLIDEQTNEQTMIYEVVLNLLAVSPDIIFGENPQEQLPNEVPTTPYNTEPPTTEYTPEYSPEMYTIMSDISRMQHETSMAIINNMSDSDYTYDYSYDY